MFLGFQSKWSRFPIKSLSCLSLPALQGTPHLSFEFEGWVTAFSKAFQNFFMHKCRLAASKNPRGNNLPASLCCFFLSLTQETQPSQHPEVQCLLSLINWDIAFAEASWPGTAPWEKAKANVKLCFLSFEKPSPVIALCLKTVISYILFSNMAVFKWKVESCYSAPTRSTMLCFFLTNDVGSF